MRMASPPFPHQRAFTLVELLIVVSLLGVLAALLFAVSPAIAERGNLAKCSHNLRQISVIIANAAAENNNTLPWYDRSKAGFNGLWWHIIYRASGLSPEPFSALFTCPTAARQNRSRQIRVTTNETLTLSYRYNKRLGYNTGSEYIANYTLKKQRTHSRPASIPIVADTSTPVSDNAPGFDEWSQVLKSHQNETSGNVLFLDGHVELLSFPGPAADAPNYDIKIKTS